MHIFKTRNSFKINGNVLYATKDPQDRASGGSARIKLYLMCGHCEEYLQAINICNEECSLNLVFHLYTAFRESIL